MTHITHCKTLVVVRSIVAACLLSGAVSAQEHSLDDLWSALDRNGDGIVSKYEGAEAIMHLVATADGDDSGGVDLSELTAHLKKSCSQSLL